MAIRCLNLLLVLKVFGMKQGTSPKSTNNDRLVKKVLFWAKSGGMIQQPWAIATIVFAARMQRPLWSLGIEATPAMGSEQ